MAIYYFFAQSKEGETHIEEFIGKLSFLAKKFTFYAPNLWRFANMPLDAIVYYEDDSSYEEGEITVAELRQRIDEYKTAVLCKKFY